MHHWRKRNGHNGNTIFVEDLGNFSGFKMVYDFENVAYSTPIGKISQPFRTQFGYHVVEVLDKRKSRGEVTVGHIMVMNQQQDSTVIPETRIKEIKLRDYTKKVSDVVRESERK